MNPMKRLSFGFYQALAYELDTYIHYFSQLQRDYTREINQEILLFAVDFSELYNYIHASSTDASRAEINTYVFNTLDDQFSMLPGAIGELLTDLERSMPRRLKPEFGRALYSHPSVVEFVSAFREGTPNEERLRKLYANAEAEIGSAFGGILDVFLRGGSHTPIKMLRKLLDQGKLAPIDGIKEIGPFSPESKRLAKYVETSLDLSRPELSENNQIDAIDFLFALLLNQQESSRARYITIYSQAESLIEACRSRRELQWNNDYLIREAKYLQFRAKLQELFGSIQERLDRVVEWQELCLSLQKSISSIVDVDEKIQEEPIEKPLEVMDLYRRFAEECREPLLFSGIPKEKPFNREQARKLYETLKDEEVFVGKTQEAYDVLEEHFREVHNKLGAFTPERTDTSNVAKYKANLRRWLTPFD